MLFRFLAVALVLPLLLAYSAFAERKDEEVGGYLRVMQALRDVAASTTSDSDWGAIRAKIAPIVNNNLNDDQLFRIGISCHAASIPGEAGDHVYDATWEIASFECARLLSNRKGPYVGFLLQQMKGLYGWDGANATTFKRLIEAQKSLK